MCWYASQRLASALFFLASYSLLQVSVWDQDYYTDNDKMGFAVVPLRAGAFEYPIKYGGLVVGSISGELFIRQQPQ